MTGVFENEIWYCSRRVELRWIRDQTDHYMNEAQTGIDFHRKSGRFACCIYNGGQMGYYIQKVI